MMNLHKHQAVTAGFRLALALTITSSAASSVRAQAFPTFPGGPPIEAIGEIGAPGLPQNASEYSTVSEIHFKYATQIPSPGDRSLALSRIASTATFSNQLDMAEKSVTAAASAALLIPQGLVRDQRLVSTVAALLELAEARIRDGVDSATPIESAENTVPLPKLDRTKLIRTANEDWKLAADLARKIANPTYRNEMMYRVSDGMGVGSLTIVNDFPRVDESATDKPHPGFNVSYGGLPDQILREAATLASAIERPVWHDRALVSIAATAAQSRQFSRAWEIARMIPQPEVRTDALLKVAENQARKNDPQGATATYKEAALGVASIPLDDPRAVLAGVLIDNLISVGRFDDARASVVLYPDQARKMIALGAIAESMGRRGSAQAALAWINQEVPTDYRSQLFRRVSNGVVSAIVNNRTNREPGK